jgi:hypothetical protein
MKRMKILIILMALSFRSYAPEYRSLIIGINAPIQPYEALWNATCKVESGFDAYAIGDKNLKKHSYGIAQIRESRLRDFNNATGNHYAITDMFDVSKSKEVFMYYCTGADLEKIAKAWNGSGPMTVKYWKLIKPNL